MKSSQYVLKVVRDNREESIPIHKTLLIGRDEQMDVLFEDPSVSSKHAQIHVNQDIAHIEDFGSTNGTFVNGVPVRGKVTLKNNDIVTIGNCKCVFVNSKEKTKKYITICSTQNKQKHKIKIIVANQKLTSNEAMETKKDLIATTNEIIISSSVDNGTIVADNVYMEESSRAIVSEIAVLPFYKKNILSIVFQKNNTVLQRVKIPLQHYAYYAHKFICWAVCVPILFFFIDGIQFKSSECPFLIATVLKLVYLLGGFTMVGILLGITFTTLALVFYGRAQQVNVYHKDFTL